MYSRALSLVPRPAGIGRRKRERVADRMLHEEQIDALIEIGSRFCRTGLGQRRPTAAMQSCGQHLRHPP